MPLHLDRHVGQSIWLRDNNSGHEYLVTVQNIAMQSGSSGSVALVADRDGDHFVSWLLGAGEAFNLPGGIEIFVSYLLLSSTNDRPCAGHVRLVLDAPAHVTILRAEKVPS